MASSSSSRSAANFCCGSCWVPLGPATPQSNLSGRGGESGGGAPALHNVDSKAGGEDAHADQLAGRQIPPGVPRKAAEEAEDAAALLVAAEGLDGGAQRRVEHEVEGQQFAVEALARSPIREEEEDQRAAEGLVELRRVDRNRGRGAGGHEVVCRLRLVGERFGRKARCEQVVRVAR